MVSEEGDTIDATPLKPSGEQARAYGPPAGPDRAEDDRFTLRALGALYLAGAA
ncbi:MAG: hypothetical protein QOE27_1506, partial [Solirubrobacteraceae bacterium]|nr:hypothetical protein [Solirubrobacteraceae bacterium]